MGIFKRKNDDEIAVVADAAEELEKRDDTEFVQRKRQVEKKRGLFGQVGDVIDTVKGVKSSFDEVYTSWIKPIMDNRAQIKRRWNGLVTAISVIFFLLYVPILLFSKIAKGLSLGWDVALYTCIGVYVVAVVVMVLLTVASGKSTNTQAAKRWRKASGIILFAVRIASLALSITAIFVSGEGESTALDTVLMVLAITSIIFTSLSLVFGGIVGFVKWLIAPSKIRYKFAFVAFEWKQTLDDGVRLQDKRIKKAYSKNAVRVGECLDKYFLPQLAKLYVDVLDGEKILALLNEAEEADKNLCGWIVGDLFAYAKGCGYINADPCEELGISGDILREKPQKIQRGEQKKRKCLIGRKKSDEQQSEENEE